MTDHKSKGWSAHLVGRVMILGGSDTELADPLTASTLC